MPPLPSPEAQFLADITTKPIFYHNVYCSEALALPHGQNEEDLDNQLLVAAADAAIEDPYRYLTPAHHGVSSALSTMTLGSEQRSSMSIHSQETQSTSITSHQSRTSKDHTLGEIAPAMHTPPIAHDSDYVSVMNHFRPPIVHKPSSSSASIPASLVSANSSLSKPTPRKHKRASGLFAIFRKDSYGSFNSQRSHHSKSQVIKLECGHALSNHAIRVHIEEALGKKDRVAPSCCGKPFPRALLDTVLTKEEAEFVSTTFVLPDSTSVQDSGYSDDGISSINVPHTLTLQAQSNPSEPCIAPVLSSHNTISAEEVRLDSTLANEAFKSLRAEEQAQFQRVSQFEANQRRALSSYYARSQAHLTAQFEHLKEEKPKQHALDLERLDETQIIAEHDLRKAQAQETQNVATALKYMEAYCSGNKPINSEISHTVTEEDLKKLARQHLMQQKLPARHESAINVLRARQEKDTKLKIQKQQAELRLLVTDYEKDRCATELQFEKDTNLLDALIESRRQRLINRWDLKFEIWRRNWEHQHGATLRGRLPHEEWPVPADPHAPLDPTSSLAVYQDTLA